MNNVLYKFKDPEAGEKFLVEHGFSVSHFPLSDVVGGYVIDAIGRHRITHYPPGSVGVLMPDGTLRGFERAEVARDGLRRLKKTVYANAPAA